MESALFSSLFFNGKKRAYPLLSARVVVLANKAFLQPTFNDRSARQIPTHFPRPPRKVFDELALPLPRSTSFPVISFTFGECQDFLHSLDRQFLPLTI